MLYSSTSSGQASAIYCSVCNVNSPGYTAVLAYQRGTLKHSDAMKYLLTFSSMLACVASVYLTALNKLRLMGIVPSNRELKTNNKAVILVVFKTLHSDHISLLYCAILQLCHWQ